MKRTYKKVEVDGKIFIEETLVRLIGLDVFEKKIAKAQAMIDLE